MTHSTTPDVSPPAGATFVGDWDKHGTGMPIRFITFAECTYVNRLNQSNLLRRRPRMRPRPPIIPASRRRPRMPLRRPITDS